MIGSAQQETPRVLVIDDDQTIVNLLEDALQEAGYTVAVAHDGNEGFELAKSFDPDLMIIDLMMPRVDGYTLCRELRQTSNAPIIIISATQDELHRIAAFELGANDFVSKPFSTNELLARVRSLLRWMRAIGAPNQHIAPDPSRTIIEAGQLRVDMESRRAWRNGQELDLTNKEFELLAYLMDRSNVALSREHLMKQIWADTTNSGLRTIDVHIHSLREKIEENPASPRYIQTVRGIGYRFHLPTANRQAQEV